LDRLVRDGHRRYKPFLTQGISPQRSHLLTLVFATPPPWCYGVTRSRLLRLWPLGWLAERLVLKRYLRRLIFERAEAIREEAKGASRW